VHYDIAYSGTDGVASVRVQFTYANITLSDLPFTQSFAINYYQVWWLMLILPSIYCCLSTVYQRWNRVWTFDPWPDPDAFDPVTRPGRWVSVLWIERLLWQLCATSECFLSEVSGLCGIHTDHDVQIHSTQNPTDSGVAYSCSKATIKCMQNLQKPGQTPGPSHWPVTRSDLAKIVDPWSQDPVPTLLCTVILWY